MKKILTIVAILALSLLAVSCNKNSNGGDSADTVKIIGTWKLEGASQKVPVDVPFGVKTTVINENTITLKKDMFEKENPETIVYNYTRKGNTLTFTPQFLDHYSTLGVVESNDGFLLGGDFGTETEFFYVFSK